MKKRNINGAEHHRIAGHDFYVMTPKTVPMTRTKEYIASLREVDWGLTGDDLEAGIDLGIEYLNRGDFTKAATMLEMIKAYRESSIQPRVLWRVGNNFILIDDEPVDEFSAKHTELKGLLCEKNKEVEYFFFNQSIHFVISSQEFLNTFKAEDYLTDQNLIKSETTFLNRIGSSRYKSKKQDSTTKTMRFNMRGILQRLKSWRSRWR